MDGVDEAFVSVLQRLSTKIAVWVQLLINDFTGTLLLLRVQGETGAWIRNDVLDNPSAKRREQGKESEIRTTRPSSSDPARNGRLPPGISAQLQKIESEHDCRFV
jgi:hypothetical protein